MAKQDDLVDQLVLLIRSYRIYSCAIPLRINLMPLCEENSFIKKGGLVSYVLRKRHCSKSQTNSKTSVTTHKEPRETQLYFPHLLGLYTMVLFKAIINPILYVQLLATYPHTHLLQLPSTSIDCQNHREGNRPTSTQISRCQRKDPVLKLC